ncbi:MAG: AMP-binding protein [Pseudomonadota bacterium]
MNMALWLERAAKAYPNATAIMRGDHIMSDYALFAERAAKLATGLRDRLGLMPGDRVAIVSENRPSYLDVLYGVWWAGLVVVPINAKLHGAEIGWIVENAGAKAVFTSHKLETAVASHLPETVTTVLNIGSDAYQALFQEDPSPVMSVLGEHPAWLFYTSGTTGKPKGATLSHASLAACAYGYLIDVDPTDAGDGLLHAAPMSHGSGMYIMPTVARVGINMVPDSGSFEPAEILAHMQTYPRTSMFAAPTMIKRLVDHDADTDCSGIRTIIWGGAPMHVADTERALERFGPVFAQIYGQGETPMTTTVLSKVDIADRDHPRWRERLGSAGLPNSMTEVRVANGTSDPLNTGDAGEVLVRGSSVMSGYWNNREATAAALKEGWLHTGDVGSFDADGYLTLKGRSKDVIISGGTNIYPREVEEVLLQHPGVREVSVIGRPDPEWGEAVVAYVAGEAAPGDLDALCSERIARFKRPKDYVFVEALPKNNYGKILKTELRDRDARQGDGT